MSAYMDDDDDVCFVFQEDEDADHSTTQLKDLAIGDAFMFKGERLTKRSNLGWALGICNVVDEHGNLAHLHPTTRISLIH